jgi:CheY-like chemotaxis protein
MKQKLNCVLLIDDDEPTNFMSNMVLEEAECASHIQIMQSAKNALDYLTKSDDPGNENVEMPYPELIFLDVNMPAMNGWEFLDKYNELQRFKSKKPIIIMLTTSINPDDQLKANQIPLVAGFENKPLTSDMIESLIKKHFDNYLSK